MLASVKYQVLCFAPDIFKYNDRICIGRMVFLTCLLTGGIVKSISFLFCLLVSQWVSALTVTEVATGIFVHFGQPELPNKENQGAIANIGFIIGDTCIAVIDTGGNPKQGIALKQTIAKISKKPICYVINTHVHPDHILGNLAFKQQGVKFIGHHNLARAMAIRSPYYLARATEQLAIKLSYHHFIPPDQSVKKYLQLDLGGRKLMLTAHPTAHTDNDLTIYDKKTQTLWMSDLLFLDHIPVIDGSLKGWIKELKRMRKKAYKVVIPGHGPVVTDWPKSCQPEIRYLDILLTEIREMLAKGQFLEQAIEKVGVSEKDNWKLFTQFHKKNVTSAFAELEWED